MPLVKYGRIVIRDPQPTPAPEDFALIEAAVGVSLPSSFVDFMSVAHGGSCFGYYIPSSEGPFMFPDIFRVGSNDQEVYSGRTILDEIERVRREYGIPHDAVPFASGGDSAPLILDLSENGRGRVASFREDAPETKNLWHDEYLVLFANTFSEYIERLYLDENEEVSYYLDAVAEGNSEAAQLNAEFLDAAIPGWRKYLVVKGSN